ncbi:hypothetical protein L3Q82_015115 [Scortum barcoo]|uniref:Uncharacterized protein n=1 Tax=Scortum barcoo TaxID=214431 RepID=A0ACB8VUV7_9TELE|nr:hypothetical protein L3Q82_015115 [Scortum barcoo]
MDQGVVDSPVTLVIKAPNQKYDDQTISCYQNWTVEKLKAHLSDVYPSKPSSKDQRLVYSGKLLLDHFTLKDVLRKQDEYHMLHLVCASRTPPSSPKPPRSRGNKPRENSASPAVSLPRTSHAFPFISSAARLLSSSSSLLQSPSPLGCKKTPSKTLIVLPLINIAGHLQERAVMDSDSELDPSLTTVCINSLCTAQMFLFFVKPYQIFFQLESAYSPQLMPPTNMPAYYNPITIMWWQQLYARQYYMHYQLLAASSQHLRPDQPSSQSTQPDPLSQRPQADRRGNPEVQMNAQGGEILNEEELNRDWLDWVYTFSRAAILLSVVYFYSSFSRFIMVMVAMLVLYLHQAGWFPFNLENELLQLPGDRANQEDMEGDLQNPDLQEMEGAMDDGSDDDGESGEEGAEDPNSAPNTGFLSSTWSFIITFFMSLIPEGPPNAAN